MFDHLSQKLTSGLRRVQGYGRLTEANIEDVLNDVKKALLEADVNFRVVKSFLKAVQSRALGLEVQKSITPGQQFLKIVNEELTLLMGGENQTLIQAPNGPTIVLMVGLQGSGKTSSVGKLAQFYKEKGKRPYVVPADVYRPAAIEQLIVLAKTIGIPYYPSTPDQNPVDLARWGLDDAKSQNTDIVFVDTAGRLHIDDVLMLEIEHIRNAIQPHEILFVADAMTGQDAVNVAKAFNDRLGVTGVILSKMDGDARGGAALSIRAITQKPIKFVTVGEKLGDLQPFYPERIASRILGMGDILSLIEKAESAFDERKELELQSKFRGNTFTLEDFRDQLRTIQRMGSIKDLLGMIPGMDARALSGANLDEKQFSRIDAMISSMTRKERFDHDIINGSRRLRIAKGSGSTVNDVNRLLKQFEQMSKMMHKLSRIQDPRKAMQAMRSMMR